MGVPQICSEYYNTIKLHWRKKNLYVAEVEMLFTKTFDLSDLPFSKELSLPEQMQNDVFRVRVGRGGRLIMEKKLDQSHQSEDSSDYFLNSLQQNL